MQFRKAIRADAKDIMTIISQAQAFLREQGIDQWQDDYPNLETIMDDIKNDNSYVLLKEGIIVGTAAIIFGIEETYTTIFDGGWKADYDYGTIHRLAIHSSYKGIGLASRIFASIENICIARGIRSIRVDTHEKNIPMQKSLYRNGYEYCGIIYLQNGSKRVAFEKILF